MAKFDVDVVVIGSGAGGLAAALALAQAGRSVLVCEQHEVPGGWCHSFTLEGYRYSPGVHYIGALETGGSMRKIFEGLGVSEDLAFCQLNPDGYDHVLVGEERFDFPAGKERFARRLKDRFPGEGKGIDGYLEVVTSMPREMVTLSTTRGLGGAIKAPFRSKSMIRWGWRTAQALVDHYVSDPLLKAILLAQSGDHGLPPSIAPAPLHIGIANHYIDGGYYPLGGAFTIPRAFSRGLKKAGGEILLSTRVEKVLLEGGRAIGVQLEDGREIHCQIVISNADPEITFGQLVGRSFLSPRLRRRLDRVTYSISALSLFLATDMNLREAGLDSGNFWYYEDEDIDRLYRQGSGDHIMHVEQAPMLFLTATTLKDPSKMHRGHHTLEAFTFVNYEPFRRWANWPSAGQSAEDRPAEYQALKQELAEKMLKTVDQIVPGLRDNLVYCNLGTPLTNEYYLNATNGNIYGVAHSRRQAGPFAFPYRTEIENLWLCGASTPAGHGVAGASLSGLMVAKGLLRCRLSDLLQAGGPELAIYPSEDSSLWPARLQRRIELGQKKNAFQS